jgi:hypothetical protein
VIAVRKWDTASASYKDDFVSETAIQKVQHEGVAYVFRRVMFNSYSGEKRAYSELEVEDPALVAILRSEIDNKYPGVNFDGERIYMQAPFPAIVRP